MLKFTKLARYILAGLAITAGAASLSPSAHADPVTGRLRGHVRIAGGANVGGAISIAAGLSTYYTAAGSAFLPTCGLGGLGPSYPATWIWDPAKITGTQPISATYAMNLPTKIEQYRSVGGVSTLVATYTKFNGNIVNDFAASCGVPNRDDDPSADLVNGVHTCGGPFTVAARSAAWKPGDTFLVYPGVYNEAVSFAPVIKYTATPTNTVAAGDTTFTLASVSKLSIGDALVRSAQVQGATKITNIDPVTKLVTISKPLLTAGAQSINFWQDSRNITIQGVVQNIPGYGDVRPAIRFNDTVSPAMVNGPGGVASSIKGMVDFFSGDDADIANLTWDSVDVLVDKPPYGQRSWLYGTGVGLIYFGGTEVQGDISFKNTRVMGAVYLNAPGGTNGIITGGRGALRVMHGTWYFDRMEFAYNGGSDGPAHNMYMGEGSTAAEATSTATATALVVTNSWFHNTKYGHGLKTRFLDNTFIGNYFEGVGDPVHEADGNWGESDLIHMVCGGGIIAKNNIFVKRHSADSTNGVMIRYFDDATCVKEYTGNPTSYPIAAVLNHPIHLENNTWVALSKRGEGLQVSSNVTYPFDFKGDFPPGSNTRSVVIPGDPYFPTQDVSIKNNVFAGFCPTGLRVGDFPWNVGSNSPNPVGPNIYASFADLNQSYSLNANYVPQGDSDIVGVNQYEHVADPGQPRQLATFGAQDSSPGSLTDPVPDVYFWADHYFIPSGGLTILHWNSTGANNCTATGAWTGSKASTGSQSIAPPSSVPTDYTLSCTGPTGTSAPTTLTINAIDPPTLTSFAANGTTNAVTTAAPSTAVLFSWLNTNVDYCNFAGPVLDSWRANWHATYFPAQTQRYYFRCNGVSGWTPYQSILVTVNSGGVATVEKPTVHLDASQTTITLGAGETSTNLLWDSSGTTGCTGTNFSTGGLTSGTVTVTPGQPAYSQKSYSISCTGPGGTTPTRSITISTAP